MALCRSLTVAWECFNRYSESVRSSFTILMVWIDSFCIATHPNIDLWLHKNICTSFLHEVDFENLHVSHINQFALESSRATYLPFQFGLWLQSQQSGPLSSFSRIYSSACPYRSIGPVLALRHTTVSTRMWCIWLRHGPMFSQMVSRRFIFLYRDYLTSKQSSFSHCRLHAWASQLCTM